MGDKSRLGKVDAVGLMGGRGWGNLANAVRVCGGGAEGIPPPLGKRHFQGRTVVGHMIVRSEAPA